jgi:UbiD family decarboxylase
MPYSDLREFIARLEEEKEILRVRTEVDIQYEMGAICRHVLNQGGVEKNAALFFEKPKGHTIPVAAGLLDSCTRYYLATGIPRENFWQTFMKKMATPVAPRVVKQGACKENVFLGKEVDLTRFPIPTWNEQDGGPYITQGVTIIKNPETGVRNVGMYRLMVHDGQSLGILAAQYRQITEFVRKAHGRGEAFPVAISIGQDPAITAASIVALPPDTDELGLAGAFRGEPVDLVRCETIPLEVPATAEIVIEGEIRPGEMRPEGPFGEYTGYYGERMPRPVISVKAITHRNDPVFQACYQGRPPNCDMVTQVLSHEAQIMARVHPLGLRKIRMCTGSAMFMAIAAIHKEYAGQERNVACAILGTPSGKWIKTLIMIDDDIDPDNWTDVEWALGTRFQPAEDVMVLPGMTGIVLDPSILEGEKRANASRTSKLVIDATKPIHRSYPGECRPKPEVMEKVLASWDKYGIPLAKKWD